MLEIEEKWREKKEVLGMKLISASLTSGKILDETKTVTRRVGWWNLIPGTKLCVVDRVMGFKKGEKPTRLKVIEVISVRAEPLNHITQEDVVKEGFPGWTTKQFVSFFCEKMKCKPTLMVNRIEFKYVGEPV